MTKHEQVAQCEGGNTNEIQNQQKAEEGSAAKPAMAVPHQTEINQNNTLN